MSSILYFSALSPISSFIVRSTTCSSVPRVVINSSKRKVVARKISASSLFSSDNNVLSIPTQDDMYEFGALLSMISCRPSSIILLEGDLGAGKTTLAQGFIQTTSGESTQVTSPTYLLCNTYPYLCKEEENDEEKLADPKEDIVEPLLIHHMDLYRLEGTPQELRPLNLPHVFQHHVSLIEWPQRMGEEMLPEEYLIVRLNIVRAEEKEEEEGDNEENTTIESDLQPRKVQLIPHGKKWEERIQSIIPYMEDWIIPTSSSDES